MSTFSYIARDEAGQRVTGRLSGTSEQTVLAELESRNLAPVSVEAVREGPRIQRRVTIRHLATAYQQLADLLAAGVPLLRGLRLIGRSKASPRLAEVVTKVADQVADGARLADAMSAHERVFPPIQVAMIRAGERGGFLEQVFQRMASYLERQADLRGKVVGNMIYPIVLLAVSLVIVIIALVFFVPKFESFYAGQDSPLPTKIVLGASKMLTTWWLATAVIAAALGAAGWWALQQPAVRRTLAIWQLAVPALGRLIANLAVARFCRMLGTLLENGVPLLAAMQIARDAAGHPLLAEAIGDATDAVRAGETLAKPLEESGLFDEDIVEMISVGESANNLPTVLTTIADTIERRIDRLLGVLVRLMEPILLLMMGGVVMFIFLALVLPMMRLSASMAGG